MLTRRAFVRSAAALAGGTAAGASRLGGPRQPARAAPLPGNTGEIPGWPRYAQDLLGLGFQYPPGWTPRMLENGLASVTSGRDGITGARALGELLTVKPGTTSAALLFVLAANFAVSLDRFEAAAAVRLASTPDLSALRYTLNSADGPRKGTLVVQVDKGGAAVLAFDAAPAQYAAQISTLTTIIRTFRWYQPGLALRQEVEPNERAFTALVPEGWPAQFQVIRPAIDAGFVARAVDPAGQTLIEAHLPQTPAFALPSQLLREGTWYHMGDRWGIQPYLVLPYLPGKEYIRGFALPQLGPQRADLRLLGWGDRPDLAGLQEAALARRLPRGGADGGEAEYAWTGPGGVRMRGRIVVLTILEGGLWGATTFLRAEAPEPQFNLAVAALTTMSGSLRPNAVWQAAAIKGAAARWRIIIQTQREVFNTYQETLQHRQEVFEKAAEAWDQYIRYTFSGASDFGAYVPFGPDTVLTADGKIVPVVGLGGQSVGNWSDQMQRSGQTPYLVQNW